MKLTIVHLYYDLLNLYGESGNVKALKKQLEKQNCDVKIIFKTLDDELNFNDYDIVYIGAGTEENQALALNHLIKYQKEIKEYIEQEKFLIATGNAIELFGSYQLDQNNKKKKCLNIFPFHSKQEVFRMVDEAIFKSNLITEPIIGFQNQGSVLKENPYPMFDVIKGVGSYPNSQTEGIYYKHFYGTYLIGPFLIRNPYFLKYLIKTILKKKQPDFKCKKFNLKLEIEAYQNFLKQHEKQETN